MLHRSEVLRRLAKLDAVPDLCLDRPKDGVLVSTVHRAKGGEADHVFWLDTPLVFDDQTEETAKLDALKASYVAVTRARRDICMVTPSSKNYMRPLDQERWIKLSYKNSKWPSCSGIVILPGDVDLLSFIPDGDEENIQTLLAELQPGLDLQLFPTDADARRPFEILFDGKHIGTTTETLTEALRSGFDAVNKQWRPPVSLNSVYISGLVTVICPEQEGSGNIYRRSGCWLGYEMSGFANIIMS